MTERVREILSWYGSDTPGTKANIARLLNHGRLGGTGRLVILKLNNSDSLAGGGDPCPALTGSVDEALRLGCAAIGFTIYPGSAARNEMYGQIRALAEEAKRKGLAVVVWSYPRGGSLSKEGETAIDVVAYAAQIAAQLRAHVIKIGRASCRERV